MTPKRFSSEFDYWICTNSEVLNTAIEFFQWEAKKKKEETHA